MTFQLPLRKKIGIMMPCDAFFDVNFDWSYNPDLESLYIFNWTANNSVVETINVSGSGLKLLYLDQFDVLTSLGLADLGPDAELLTQNGTFPLLTSVDLSRTRGRADMYANPTTVFNLTDAELTEFRLDGGGIVDPTQATSISTLRIVGATLPSTTCDMSAIAGLQSVFMMNLEGITGLTLAGSTTLTEFTLGNVGTVETLDLSGCTALPSLNILFLPSLTSVDLTGCSSLSNLNANEFPAVTEFLASGCAFAEADVNVTLVLLDQGGLSNGVVHLEGGTSAPPSSTGLTAKSALESRGWSVFVNT